MRTWQRQLYQYVVKQLRSPSNKEAAGVYVYDDQQPWISRLYRVLMHRKRQTELANVQCIRNDKNQPLPVISVGNTTFGATGKTPFIHFLVENVIKHHRPLLLTRGYGDDEWRFFRDTFPHVAMAVGSNRLRAAAAFFASSKKLVNCIVLDDGLQQWCVQKHLEIVMIDALHPFGNGKLLPCGSLREEPAVALARADIVVLHHFQLLPSREKQQALRVAVQSLLQKKNALVTTSSMRVKALLPLSQYMAKDTNVQYESSWHEKTAIVLCGVGNPESVAHTVQSLGFHALYMESFPDHHAFTDHELQEVCGTYTHHQNEDLVVITTEKDVFRSGERFQQSIVDKFQIPVLVLQCELALDQESDELEAQARVNKLFANFN